MLSPNPEQYPGEIIEKDLAQGKIDAAIVWVSAGYYAKQVRNLDLALIPLKSEPGVRSSTTRSQWASGMASANGKRRWKS
jgi:hypothetical protein